MGILAVLLTVLFVALKLAHIIAWSWLLVFSPLIAAVMLTFLFFVFAGFILRNILKRLAR